MFGRKTRFFKIRRKRAFFGMICFLIVSIATLSSLIISKYDDQAALHPLPERKDRADVKTLELVQIIWRHGDRTPMSSYPNDPFADESFWAPYATGFKSLTKIGQKMHYDLGKYLRQRYDGFLSNVYSPKEIYVQSSDTDRSIMSALANMAGLWPSISTDPRSEWNLELNWQAIPVHTIPKEIDNFIDFKADCPRFKEFHQKSYKTTPIFAAIIDQHKIKIIELCQYLQYYSGTVVDDINDIKRLYGILSIQKLYNLTLPLWVTPEVYDDMEKLSGSYFDSRVYIGNDEAKRVLAGPLLNVLVKNMDIHRDSPFLTPTEKSMHTKSKMYAISGHDTTIATILGALGVFDTQRPEYASAAIFEMHKASTKSYKAAGNIHDYFVRVFLRNDTSVPPFEFKIPNCGFPCRLDTFKKLFSNIIVTNDQWYTACQPGGSM